MSSNQEIKLSHCILSVHGYGWSHRAHPCTLLENEAIYMCVWCLSAEAERIQCVIILGLRMMKTSHSSLWFLLTYSEISVCLLYGFTASLRGVGMADLLM